VAVYELVDGVKRQEVKQCLQMGSERPINEALRKSLKLRYCKLATR
jgi:hypothetical protein